MNLLITSKEELADYVSFSGDLDYATLKPAIRAAQDLLATYVGGPLLAQLSGDELSADQEALKPLVQAPIAHLALLKFVNSANVRITDLGVMRTKTADSLDAFEWQLERVVMELKSGAFSGIESLLGYLAANLVKFPAYTASVAYLQETAQLISSAGVFGQYYDIAGSRLVFQTLLPSMRTDEIAVRRALGAAYAGLLTSPLSPLQAQQLDAARRALVYLTIARALRERLVSITDMGVQVMGISQFGTIKFSNSPTDKQLATSITYFDSEAQSFLSDLVSLIPPAPSSIPSGSRVTGSAIVAF